MEEKQNFFRYRRDQSNVQRKQPTQSRMTSFPLTSPGVTLRTSPMGMVWHFHSPQWLGNQKCWYLFIKGFVGTVIINCWVGHLAVNRTISRKWSHYFLHKIVICYPPLQFRKLKHEEVKWPVLIFMVSEELELYPGWPCIEVKYQCVLCCIISGFSEALEILKYYPSAWPEILTRNMPIELRHHVSKYPLQRSIYCLEK